MRLIITILFLIINWDLCAEIPRDVQIQASVNEWVQGTVKETFRVFDLAIQGRGFFVIQGKDETYEFTRYGSFYADNQGFLVQKTSRKKLLDVSMTPINVIQSTNSNNSSIRSYNIKRDGIIDAIFSDGKSITIGTVGLALFRDISNLRRASEHNFTSDEFHIGKAKSYITGDIFSSCLEELDQELYSANGFSKPL